MKYGTLSWRRFGKGSRYVSTCKRYTIHQRNGYWCLTDIRPGAEKVPFANGASRSLRGAMWQANEKAKMEKRNGA